jgi:hypothetical protein
LLWYGDEAVSPWEVFHGAQVAPEHELGLVMESTTGVPGV